MNEKWVALFCCSRDENGVTSQYLEFGPKINGYMQPIGRIYGDGSEQQEIVNNIVEAYNKEIKNAN